MKKIIVLICLLLPESLFSQSAIELKRFSPDELKSDLNRLFEKLESIHPSAYHYTSKDKVQEARAVLEKELNSPMTRLEFARKAIPIVAMLENGHTSLSFPPEERNTFFEKGGNLFPFTVWIKFILPGSDKDLHGVRPDVEIKPSQEQIASGKDVVLEYVKQLVEAKP
ncbi:MAG: hypothetical protein JXA73_13400 [Acidobacteria bacterium]|nr:hypothetical protein [Acidobacteriota bacterium]